MANKTVLQGDVSDILDFESLPDFAIPEPEAEVSSREPTEPSPLDEVSDLVDVGARRAPDPSGADVLSTASKVAAKTLPQVTGMGAGAATGAAIGAMAPPPFNAATIPIGLGIGLLAGSWAGDRAGDQLEEYGLAADPEDVPQELRPYAYATEVLTGSLGMGGVVQQVAKLPQRLPPSMVGSMINRILDTAQKYPVRFFASETAMGAKAAAAEGAYEHYRPDHPLERMGVGISAGFFNPTTWGVKIGKRLYSAGEYVVNRFSKTGRRTAAAKELHRLLKASGNDPEVYLELLSDTEGLAASVPGFNPTASQLTGSKRLAEIEANLSWLDQKFMGERAAKAKKSLDALSNQIQVLELDGSPAALQHAAKLRTDRYKTMLGRVLAYAEREAVESAQNIIRKDGEVSRSAISQEAADILEGAIKRAREAETQLWEQAAGGADAPASPRAIFRMYNRLRGEMLEVERLPKEVEGELAEIRNSMKLLKAYRNGETNMEDGAKITKAMVKKAERLTSVGHMMKFRSRMLAYARGAARSSDVMADDKARQYGLLASAALNDLIRAGAATVKTASGQRRVAGGKYASESAQTAYDAAREYSAALHDVFSRSFAGAARREGAHGAVIPPEVFLKQAFSSRDEVGALRLRELQDAAEFLPPRGLADTKALEDTQQTATYMMDVQSRFLRVMADEMRDGKTGAVNAKRLRGFMDKSASEFKERFPEVWDDLERAVASQERLETWTKRVSGLTRKVETQSIMAEVLGVDSAVDAVYGAMRSAQPITKLNKMVALAKGYGDVAVEGLRAALWEAALRRARNNKGEVNLELFEAAINNPMRPGLPSVRQFMIDRQLMPEALLSQLDNIDKLAANVRTSMATPGTGEPVIQPTNVLANFFVRIGGAELARKGLQLTQKVFGIERGGSTGSSLIASHRGSSAAQEFVERIPSMKLQGMLVEALSGAPLKEDDAPFSLLRVMLEPPGTNLSKGARLQRIMQLHAYAWQAGYLGAEDELEAEEAPPDERFSDVSDLLNVR